MNTSTYLLLYTQHGTIYVKNRSSERRESKKEEKESRREGYKIIEGIQHQKLSNYIYTTEKK